MPSRQPEITVVQLLARHQKTVATAESCTGGLVANVITDVPGASNVFVGGIVVYTDAMKRKWLGVRAGTLRQHSAVSAQVARQMAEGARKTFGSDFAIATTGYAGPDGGGKGKPVGTVFIALAHASGTLVVRRLNRFDRKKFKLITAQQALELLVFRLQEP